MGLGAERVPLALAPRVGNWSARRIWYWARACSMFCTATRRSRLPASASSIRVRRLSSRTNCCQGRSAAAGASLAVLSVATGQSVLTGAAGRS